MKVTHERTRKVMIVDDRTMLIYLTFGSMFLSTVYSATVATETPNMDPCIGILCDHPECESGMFVPEGQCCLVCPKDNCSGIVCPELNCPNQTRQHGECCPVCSLMGRSCIHNGNTLQDGESVKFDCNTCSCHDGELRCTLNVCNCIFVDCMIPNCENTHVPEGECCPVCRNETTCLYNGDVIQDGEQVKADCNTCTCNNGLLACTEMACSQTCLYNGKVIQDGGRVNIDCNTCTCRNGVLGCTEMACPQTCLHNGKVIQDGGRVNIDCNTCTCRNGILGCTKMACPQTCLHNGKVIQDGGRVNIDCNTCTCRNGILGCTKMACPQTCLHNGKVIQYGRRVNVDCNTCTCRNGVLRCTKTACRKPCHINGKTIQDGGSILIDCNVCSCTDGLVSCTMEECLSTDKSGSCPQRLRSIFDFCESSCATDLNCPGQKKCCDNGCGKSCMDPVTKMCQGVKCPFLRCTRNYTPPNQCCPVCQPF